MTTLDDVLRKYRKPLPGCGHGVFERNGVRTEHHSYTPAELAEKLDVIFSPGFGPGTDPMERDTGYIAIDANTKGRAAVEAIFPKLYEAIGAPFNWKRGIGFNEIWPEAFGLDWQACAPNVPALAAQVPNTLPEHLAKIKPLDQCSEEQLGFMMAIASRNHGARAAWLEMDGGKIKAVNILGDTDKDTDISLEGERLKLYPRTIPLSANYARKEITTILAGRKVHLFELSTPLMREIIQMPLSERLAELEGLREFDLLHLPFGDKEPIAIRFNLGPIAFAFLSGNDSDTRDTIVKAHARTVTAVMSGPVEIVDSRAVTGFDQNVYVVPEHIENDLFFECGGFDVLKLDGQNDVEQSIRLAAYEALTILLLAMNDKNIVKRDRLRDAKKKSLRGLTAGPRGMVYVSRTVLEVPEDLPLEPGTHASPRAHRRRGHKHTVLFGAGRTGRRVQWFPAVWVNGDPPDDWKPTIYEVQK